MHLPIIVRASLVAAALASAAILAIPARAQSGGPAEPPRATLTLTGSGEVSVPPDQAIVTSGVITEAPTAREALDANNAAIAEVIAAMKAAGIEAKDIQTSGFSVHPRYTNPRRGGDGAHEAPRIVGYTVNNMVTVRVRDLGALGAVLDQAVSVGANRIGGIDFVVSDADKRLDEARAAAMRDALRKAEIYAGAAGVTLARIQSISESGGYIPPRPRADMMMMRAEPAAAVPVEAGEQTLSVQVHVTWELGQ